jgi:hypothetical protein
VVAQPSGNHFSPLLRLVPVKALLHLLTASPADNLSAVSRGASKPIAGYPFTASKSTHEAELKRYRSPDQWKVLPRDVEETAVGVSASVPLFHVWCQCQHR